MDGFKLDTSGAVNVPPRTDQGRTATWRCEWDQLSPFEQGYIEALFASLQDATHTTGWAFRYLAPETLAAIRKDCEARRAQAPRVYSDTAEEGREFYARRRRGQCALVGFPPLTPNLADDGKVYLREQA